MLVFFGLLKQSNAEFYANAYKSGDVFAEARAAAETVSSKKVTAALSGLREDLVDAMLIVSAGMDKNFFQKTNHLKRSLYIGLANAGVQNPSSVIEQAFAESSAKHFETIAEMATELLDQPVEYRDTLRNSIGDAGVIDRSKDVEQDQVQASTQNSGLALAKSFAATASTASTKGSLTGSVATRKDTIRNLFNR